MNVIERQRSRDECSDNFRDTIVSRFELQVETFPDKLAIVTDRISLTYQALDLNANRIAAALVSPLFHSHRPVILFMRDEAARLATMLGALKARRIFIPLASSSPQQWVTEVIKDSRASQIIVDSSTRSIAEIAARGG